MAANLELQRVKQGAGCAAFPTCSARRIAPGGELAAGG